VRNDARPIGDQSPVASHESPFDVAQDDPELVEGSPVERQVPDKPIVNRRDEAERRARQGLTRGKLTFVMEGEKLRGGWSLVRIRRARTGGDNWLLIKRDDAFAGPGRDVTQEDRSVLSGRTIEDVEHAG